mmetsp:Transcript_14929/g.56667  ORF Transcript_14929/g.56667 Transcript_14929/m.56667 type:complete len:255 (-) Transcript_14929:1323-2087(-)
MRPPRLFATQMREAQGPFSVCADVLDGVLVLVVVVVAVAVTSCRGKVARRSQQALERRRSGALPAAGHERLQGRACHRQQLRVPRIAQHRSDRGRERRHARGDVGRSARHGRKHAPDRDATQPGGGCCRSNLAAAASPFVAVIAGRGDREEDRAEEVQAAMGTPRDAGSEDGQQPGAIFTNSRGRRALQKRGLLLQGQHSHNEARTKELDGIRNRIPQKLSSLGCRSFGLPQQGVIELPNLTQEGLHRRHSGVI